jgi:RND superfamily putative drug exporter
MFGAWGRFVYRFRWPVLLLSLGLVTASVLAILNFQTSLSTSDRGSGDLETFRAIELIDRELPSDSSAGFTLIFTAKDPNLPATDPAFAAAVESAIAPLRGDARVRSIDQSPHFVSKDGRRIFVTINLRDGFSDASDYYHELRDKVQSDQLDILSTGGLPINEAFAETSEGDLRKAEFVGLPIALVILIVVFGSTLWRTLRRTSLGTAGLALALTFGSLAIALVPIFIGAFVILGGLAGIFAFAQSRDMSIYALNVASMIGLGVAIDYSLFIISRFLDEVMRRPVRDAVVRTVATTGKAITFSGLTVAIGVAGLLFYNSAMLQSIGIAAILVVTAAVVYGITFLPALLAVAGNGLLALARRRETGATTVAAPRRAARGGVWHALALGVMARPWLVLLPLLALLLFAGSPFLRLRLGLSDARVLPERLEARQGWELLTKEFPGGENTSIPVVVHVPGGQPLTEARIGQLYDYARWLGNLPNVSRVQGVASISGPDGQPLPKEQVAALLTAPRETLPRELQEALAGSVGEHIVVLNVLTPKISDSDEARDIVRTIRAGGGPAVDGEVLVGGETGFIIDQIASLKSDTKWAVLFIVAATYVVLFLLLGSVLLPLKAVAMNLLSISASYGALVWIFQEGHLSGFFGFTPGSIDPTIPVLMFCLLFGLSMDYEVLLLSRMKEEHERLGDNRAAVAEGLEQTGQLITGAAAIMIAVFSAFALAEIVIIKAIGLGMALAVAVDALIVRALVVPATMRLLGEWNWWAPAPLAALYRRLGLAENSGIEDDGHAPEPTAAEQEREPVGAGTAD